MKKIFISQPMKGKSREDILRERENITAAIEKHMAEDMNGEEFEIISSYFEDYNPDNGCIPLKYLAKSLELLADADMLVLGEGWSNARGCIMEFNAAKLYGITGVISPRAVPAYPASSPCGLGNWSPQVLANSQYNSNCGCGCGNNCGC